MACARKNKGMERKVLSVRYTRAEFFVIIEYVFSTDARL